VLYGESGAGKSSVLAAGVANDLRNDPEYSILLIRDWRDDPIGPLIDEIRESLPEPPAARPDDLNGQREYLDSLLQSFAETTKRTLLVILDQFEEYFEYRWKEEGPGTLAEELPRLLNRNDVPINFLIAIRHDALSSLDRFKGSVPALFDNLLRIDHLSLHAAHGAIVQPLRRFNEDLLGGMYAASNRGLHAIAIDDQVAGQVVSQISAPYGEEQQSVQAAYLQLVMTRWWEREIENNSKTMRIETLQELGGVRTIVERYLEDTLSTLSIEEKEIVAEAFRYMVTPTGRKIAQTISDLINNLSGFTPVTNMRLEAILSGLQSARLLSKVPPPRGNPASDACFEFAHDMVAKAASDWLQQFRRTRQLAEAERREEEANRRAAEQTRLAELEKEIALKARQVAEESQKREAAERRRAEEQSQQVKKFRILAGVLAVILVVALGAVLFGLLQRSLARARQLAVISTLAQDTDPELSVLFAAQCVAANWFWGHTINPNAESVLRRAIMVSRVRLTVSGHSAAVTSIAWSPDGKYLATGSWDNTAIIWNAATGEQVRQLTGHRRFIASISWSPDGSRLATASWDDMVRIWDVSDGMVLATLHGEDGIASSVAWSPDSKFVAAGYGDGSTILWDLASGKEILKLHSATGKVNGVSWSPDNKRLALSSGRSAEVWDLAGKKKLVSLTGHSGLIGSIAWSPDGSRIATGSWDQTARVWDAGDGRELLALIGHSNTVAGVAWSPDGSRIATASWDNTAKVWDTQNGRELFTLKGHSGVVAGVAWSPDGERLATASWDSTAKVWDAGSNKEVSTLNGRRGPVAAIAWSPGSRRLSTANGSVVVLWDPQSGRELLRLDSGAFAPLTAVAWSPDGRRLAAAAETETTIWNADLGTKFRILKGGVSVAWSSDGKRIATAINRRRHDLEPGIDVTPGDVWDGSVTVWNATSGAELFTVTDHGRVDCIAWSPDGKWIATGNGAVANVWDAANGNRMVTLGNGDRTDVLSHAEERRPPTTTMSVGMVKSIAWAPDSKSLVLGQGSLATAWNAASGKRLATMRGHEDIVASVAWSPDGKRIATAGRDNATKVWDAGDGEELFSLSGHMDSVTSVAWSPDGKWLTSGGLDGIVQIFVVDIRDLMALAAQRVTAHPRNEGCKFYLNEDTCPAVPKLSSWP